MFKLHTADLSIALICAGVGGAAVVALLPPTASSLNTHVVGWAVGAGLYLVLAPVIYRSLQLRPMHFPPCPHCGVPDGPWGALPKRPVGSETLMCVHCGQGTEFWYRAPLKAEQCGRTAFLWRWYLPFGFWRRMH
jgi:hypothetical protein